MYQIDVKFYPDRDYVEMWVEFESYLPGSIPSYKDCFKMDWDEEKKYVQKRGGGWHGDVAGTCLDWGCLWAIWAGTGQLETVRCPVAGCQVPTI